MNDRVIEIMRTILARSGKVRSAAVFGSMARGEATEKSDLDMLIDFEKGATLIDLSRLGLDLEDALGRRVDIATPESLHLLLRDRILAESREVFAWSSRRAF